MYDNIYLLNRITMRGKIKKDLFSLINKSFKFVLYLILILFILLYCVVYISKVGFVITIDLFFESLIGSLFLKGNLVIIVLLILCIYIVSLKKKNLVAFSVKEDILDIVFTNGKFIGLEYKMYLPDISNICMYKNGVFSFYCHDISLDYKGRQNKIKGILYFIDGDSGTFVSELQDYTGKNVKFINKKI